MRMLKYYLKIAWRNFTSNKLFSFLNLIGLSVAVAICIPLFLFVSKQYSFDHMYKNRDQIYRVNLLTHGDKKETWGNVPNAVGPAIMKDIPEVSEAARVFQNGFGTPTSLRVGHENFKEDRLFWADGSLFKIFNLDFVLGDAGQVFKDKNSVVIDQSTARRLFRASNPIGKPVLVDNKVQLTVTGVYKDFPDNSSLNASLIGNYLASGADRRVAWDNASFETFCLLKSGANPGVVNKKIAGLTRQYIKDKEERWFDLELQPFSDIHLHASHISDSYLSHLSDIKTVRQLSLLGLLIVLIACINYMNLATARSENRAREVGINRKQMVARFYGDTAMTVFFSLVAGYLLSFGSLYLFNSISESYIAIGTLFSWQVLLFLLCIWFFVSLVAGSYPAILLSGHSALHLMQKRLSASGGDKFLRRALVVIQFSCSIILMIGIAFIYRQMKFIGEKNLGFSPESVLMINTSGMRDHEGIEALANSLKQLPEVKSVASMQAPPGFGTSGRSLVQKDSDKETSVSTCNADANVLPTLGLHLIAGKNLPTHLGETDSLAYLLVNKKVVDFLGYTPDEAIGKKVDAQLGPNAYIVGVVEDFNYNSLKRPIEPYIYFTMNDAPEGRYAMVVKLRTSHLVATLDKIQKAFAENAPTVAFDYDFLDTHLASLYSSERIVQKIVLLFSSLAIFVSCLGLFGLSAFMAEQRTKEIGIRKVLGASSFSISKMLSADFLKLVLIAVVIGIPLAVYLVQKWLANFAYRIHLSWVVIALACMAGLLIALLTVSFQAIKAARANPLNSIKSE